MEVRFTHVGKGAVVNCARIITIIQPRTTSAQRYKVEAETLGHFIDATKGKKGRSLIVFDDGTVMLSTLSYATLMNRMNGVVPQITKEDELADAMEAAEGEIIDDRTWEDDLPV